MWCCLLCSCRMGVQGHIIAFQLYYYSSCNCSQVVIEVIVRSKMVKEVKFGVIPVVLQIVCEVIDSDVGHVTVKFLSCRLYDKPDVELQTA